MRKTRLMENSSLTFFQRVVTKGKDTPVLVLSMDSQGHRSYFVCMYNKRHIVKIEIHSIICRGRVSKQENLHLFKFFNNIQLQQLQGWTRFICKFVPKIHPSISKVFQSYSRHTINRQTVWFILPPLYIYCLESTSDYVG